MEARIKSRESVNNTPSLRWAGFGGLYWKDHGMLPEDNGAFSLSKIYRVRPINSLYWELEVFNERGIRVQSVCKDVIEEYTSP